MTVLIRALITLLIHSWVDAVFSVRFFTQERILISNSAREDQSIKFWNVYSGEQIKSFRNHIHTGNYCWFNWRAENLNLVWNGALEICTEKKWVVVEDREKNVAIINYEYDPNSEDEILKKKIAVNFTVGNRDKGQEIILKTS